MSWYVTNKKPPGGQLSLVTSRWMGAINTVENGDLNTGTQRDV